MAARWIGALLLLFVASCGADGPNDQAAPEAAFAAFREALLVADDVSAWAFLGDGTRAALERRADAFADAGVDRPQPIALLRATWVPDGADIATVERAAYTDSHADLRFTTTLGYTAEARMLRTEAGWRVELALPEHEGLR